MQVNERYIGPIGAYNKVCLWLGLSNFKLAAYPTLSIDLVILQPRITAVFITIGPSGTYYAGGRALDLDDASDLYASLFQNLNLSCLLP